MEEQTPEQILQIRLQVKLLVQAAKEIGLVVNPAKRLNAKQFRVLADIAARKDLEIPEVLIPDKRVGVTAKEREWQRAIAWHNQWASSNA